MVDARDEKVRKDDVVISKPEKPEPKRSRSSNADALASKKAAEEAPVDPESMTGERAWYVVHCYSGYENKVRHNL